jgi:hypothetical protein
MSPFFLSISYDAPGNGYAVTCIGIKYGLKPVIGKQMIAEFEDLVRHLYRGAVGR